MKRPTAKELLNHRFIREARGTQNLVHLIKRYEGWVALAEEEGLEDQPPPQDEYSPLQTPLTRSGSEETNEMWDFGTIRPAYQRNAARPYTTNASGTMRVVHPGREPLQPLPAVQRPLTPPESQRHPPKYGGMAQPASPRKDLQVCTREDVNLFDSVDNDYYDDSEEEEDVPSTSTVKIHDRPSAVPGWQPTNSSGAPPKPAVPPKSPSPSKHARSSSQIPTPVQSQYTKSEATQFPVRSSATSSTAYAPTAPAFGVNAPSRAQSYKYNALEDVLLPALEECSRAPADSALISKLRVVLKEVDRKSQGQFLPRFIDEIIRKNESCIPARR